MDHAFIRIFWNNFHEISEGVYRANQPSPSHLKSYKKLGIKSVLSLRGRANQSYDLFEDEYCKKLVNLVYTPISSGSAPTPEDLLKIIQVLRELPKPVVLHCKSGADRAGLVSALYLLAERKSKQSRRLKSNLVLNIFILILLKQVFWIIFLMFFRHVWKLVILIFLIG